MKLTELDPALRKLRLSGMADHLEMRLVEAQKVHWAPIDLVSALGHARPRREVLLRERDQDLDDVVDPLLRHAPARVASEPR